MEWKRNRPVRAAREPKPQSGFCRGGQDFPGFFMARRVARLSQRRKILMVKCDGERVCVPFIFSFVQECDLRPSDVPCGRQERKEAAPSSGVRRAVLPLVAAVLFFSFMGAAPLQAADISGDSLLPKEKPGPGVRAVLEHYPVGSIDSVARADIVLEVIAIEKANIDARLYNEKLLCNEKFLVYKCYDEAEERKRIDLVALKPLEVEAKRFKRSEDVRQRDLALDRRRAEEEAEAPQRAENVKMHEERVKRVQEREAKREAAARGVTSTPGESHSGNLMTPAEKAENVREYQAKQEEKAKRQERVKRKKAQTQKKREQRAADEAAGRKPDGPI